MRTTLTIDDDILGAAKTLGESHGISAGKALSDLARKGLVGISVKPKFKNHFPIFDLSSNVSPITLEDVKRMEDEI